MNVLIVIEARKKAQIWLRAARSLGLSPIVISTGGHFFRHPAKISPLGLRLDEHDAVDLVRRPDADAVSRLRAALHGCSPDTRILLATDDDQEGDVIALDVASVLIKADPSCEKRIARLRPNAMTEARIAQSISEMKDRVTTVAELVDAAGPGRARAFLDRWIGAAWSDRAGRGCGRVRAASVGLSALWTVGPDLCRQLPETGDITLQARAEEGGKPFVAHISFTGTPDPILAGLARRFSGRPLPGRVTVQQSAGAAVAPRFGDLALMNTGDALAYASRHFGVGVVDAMKGLQSAYIAGRINYPRTSARHICAGTGREIVRAAHGVGIIEATHENLQGFEEDLPGHEALRPMPPTRPTEAERLKKAVRRAYRPGTLRDPDEIEDLMVSIVSRRAFEIAAGLEFRRGTFHPDPSAFSEEELVALQGVDWLQPSGVTTPWSRDGMTGLRFWPLEAIMVDGMMIEGIGRPSTWSAHAGSMVANGDIHQVEEGALPSPTPEGVAMLKSIPQAAWDPRASRAIERQLAKRAPPKVSISALVHDRVISALSAMQDDVQGALIDFMTREPVSSDQVISFDKLLDLTSRPVDAAMTADGLFEIAPSQEALPVDLTS